MEITQNVPRQPQDQGDKNDSVFLPRHFSSLFVTINVKLVIISMHIFPAYINSHRFCREMSFPAKRFHRLNPVGAMINNSHTPRSAIYSWWVVEQCFRDICCDFSKIPPLPQSKKGEQRHATRLCKDTFISAYTQSEDSHMIPTQVMEREKENEPWRRYFLG